MDATPPIAWEPVTPRGVAAFAQARLRRLLLVQAIVALLVGVTVASTLHTAFFPTIDAAIRNLPEGSEIRAAQLDWRGTMPQLLAESRHLSLGVDLEHSGAIRSLAHFQVEFGRTNVLVHSLLGYTAVKYPDGWIIALNRAELEPRWGAWSPMVLAVVVMLVVGYLMINWALLASLYCGPVWLVGFYVNRKLSLRASWRLAGAAMMPGALVMLLAILFYGLGGLDLVHLGIAFAAHVGLGWVYLAVSLCFVPRLGSVPPTKNPFTAASES